MMMMVFVHVKTSIHGHLLTVALLDCAQLVPIPPCGPLPEDISQIEFMITSGVEFSLQRVEEIFEHATSLKVGQVL